MRIGGTQPVGPETGLAKQQQALKKACGELEAVFTNYLLKSMRKTVQKADLFGSAREEEFFRDMLDAEMCSTAARTQSLGIADMLYRQLSAGWRDEAPPLQSTETDTENVKEMRGSAQ